MGDTSREIGRGRGWRLPPLRCSGGGENRRGGWSQGLQCSRVLYGSGGRGRVLYGGGRVCDGVHSTRPSGSGATGARPAEVYCKGSGAAAEYCTGAEECVEGSTAPVRRGG